MIKLHQPAGNLNAAQNNEEFRAFMARNLDVDFVQPSPDKAPWHIKAVYKGLHFNFWPHINKAQVGNSKSSKGFDGAQLEINRLRGSK